MAKTESGSNDTSVRSSVCPASTLTAKSLNLLFAPSANDPSSTLKLSGNDASNLTEPGPRLTSFVPALKTIFERFSVFPSATLTVATASFVMIALLNEEKPTFASALTVPPPSTKQIWLLFQSSVSL